MAVLDPKNLPATEEDIDFSDLEDKYSEEVLEDTLDNVVLIDCLPIVDDKKEAKLSALIKKITKNIGKIRENGIHMPKEKSDGKSLSKGYAFVEFENATQATAVVKELNGYKIDKAHVLAVNLFMDVEKYSKISETFVAPPETNFVTKEHMKYWLLDDQSRDQFCIHHDSDLSLNWNNRGKSVEVITSRNKWTETYFQWSPFGTFLVTLHRQGAALWGGPSFKKIVRFVHLSVKFVEFSPLETYFVTFSSDPISLEAVDKALGSGNEHLNPFTDDDVGNHFCIWEVKTGRLLRSFPFVTKEDGTPVTKFGWPCFKWSASESYFARLTPGSKISIYEAPGMGLVGKKSLSVPNVANFEWRPCDDLNLHDRKNHNALAYWIPEVGNQPGRVSIISVPDMNILRTKNIVSVKDIALHWHPSGEALCARINRFTKTKKSTFTSLEIFRLNEKGIPSDVVEFKDNVVVFAWEPKSSDLKFAAIHVTDPTPPQTNASGMATSAVKSNVSFYHFVRTRTKLTVKEEFTLLKTLDKKNTTSISWSPKGRYIVLSTLRTTTVWGLEFYDTEVETLEGVKVTGPNSVQLLNSVEHYGVTDLEWDPSGRYVSTSASVWRHTMENGYSIWDFKGEQLFKTVVDRFKQFLWRPRPQSLLSEAAKDKIRKNLNTYSVEFDEQDRIMESAASIEQLNLRRRLANEWNSWRKTVNARIEELNKLYSQNNTQSVSVVSGDEEVIEEIIEELLEETVEYV
ncbi:hypothetical protein BB559_001066 [Furculomyces boomerangus]|uniref:Eukaryotic translation initiation factor 3 subunit B n=2 Tax=Harpellales TaxID=61421 RepID=A0A2T9Z326_9FUNG|nr:hypothetical protein BB559_001066 [Furculomyces boomerangus]PWA00313.1 hypothetical protein BB558_003624 [Smittium angustum]